MSRIKDLLAEEQNIDDLKRPLYQELGEMIYVKAKGWDGIRSWFRNNAEYDAGKDDKNEWAEKQAKQQKTKEQPKRQKIFSLENMVRRSELPLS